MKSFLSVVCLLAGLTTATSPPLDRSKWVATAGSFEAGFPASNAIDGNVSTFWHTEYTPKVAPLPHRLSIDMKALSMVDGLTYLPRQDGVSNGNWGQHEIDVSVDSKTWINVAGGTWPNDADIKTIAFQPTKARYVRVMVYSEAQGQNFQWSSAADVNVNGVPATSSSAKPAPQQMGVFKKTLDLPLIAAAVAVLPGTTKVLMWSSWKYNQFTGGTGLTVTGYYDFATDKVTERTVSNTQHDMFCPGISMAADGEIVVTGGNSAPVTSLFNDGQEAWTNTANMNVPRGYHSSATTSDGKVFTIGGSFTGNGRGNRTGEVYDPATKAWTLLEGCPADPIVTADTQGVYRGDNHAWLFGWHNGTVVHAGPSAAMHWFSTAGTGSFTSAGTRAQDGDSMCGNAIMYDATAGLVLTVGGAPNYGDTGLPTNAKPNAHLLTLPQSADGTINVATLGNMHFSRSFANAVVAPNGHVFIIGGQSIAEPFTDTNAILPIERFNPQTRAFDVLASLSTPRNYHSTAALLPDGTIWIGGGGLCGDCATNHFDAEIYEPPYLFSGNGAKANRPSIKSIQNTTLKRGETVTFTVDGEVGGCSLIRYGTVTHSVNTDQRRVPLTPKNLGGGKYSVTLPKPDGIVLPGYWMLFVMDKSGVPSMAETIKVLI